MQQTHPKLGKWYYFEYDPKFKDQLGEWDEFPLIKLLRKEERYIPWGESTLS